MAYAYEENLIRDDTSKIDRNADVLLNASKDVGLTVNTGETKYLEIGRHRGMVANELIKIGSNSCEKILYVTVTWPRWSQSNVLASRSKARGFKPC